MRIERDGHAPGPTIDSKALAELQELYRHRAATVRERPHGHPFENIVSPQDFRVDHPLMRFYYAR